MCRIVWRNSGFQRGGFACRQRQLVRGGDVGGRNNDLNRFAGGDFAVFALQSNLGSARADCHHIAVFINNQHGGVAGSITHVQRI